MIIGAFETAILIRLLLAFYGYQTYLTVQNDQWRTNNNWLLFWLIYALFQLVEFLADFILGFLPIYYEAKLGAFVYLGLFGGATKAYEMIGKNLMQQVQAQAGKVQQNPNFQQYMNQANSLLQKKTGYTLPTGGAPSAPSVPSFPSATSAGSYGSYPSGYTPSGLGSSPYQGRY